MPLLGFDALFEEADRRREGAPVAVAGGADRTVIEALREARDRGWVKPILVGREPALRAVADGAGISLEGFQIVDADDAAGTAVAEVRSGRARLLMKGQISTPDLMRAVLNPDTGLRTGRVICQVVLMEILPSGRRFLMADTGILVQPKINHKINIMLQSVALAHALGEPRPRVALMAASERVSEVMPETFDAAELQRRGALGEFPGCVVQGPLSFDLAYAADAAEKKRLGGAVVGTADVMIFPNLVAANLTVKAIMYTADCRFGGVLRGTVCPVVFMSRADSTATRLHSLALALRALQGPQEQHEPTSTR
jgi:phosphate butyryltransferase